MAGEKKIDWVMDAYETFVRNAEGLDPTDPVKAVEAYFEKNATAELKAKCKAEGKTAKGCWDFIVAVARKVGGSCHIDPGAVYAIAMHWFQDVPVDWNKAERPAASSAPKKKSAKKAEKKSAKIEKLEHKVAQSQTEPVRRKAKEALRKAKAAAKKPKKPKNVQGFFFDMLLDTPNEDDVSSPQGAPVRPAEENAVAPIAQAGTSSESEVRK